MLLARDALRPFFVIREVSGRQGWPYQAILPEGRSAPIAARRFAKPLGCGEQAQRPSVIGKRD
jgi:hypothetical protein